MTASAVLNYQQESKGVVVTARVAAVMAAMMGTAGMFVMGTVVCRVVLLGGYRVSAPGFEIVAIVACVVVMLLLYVLLMEMVRGVLLRQKWAVVTAFIFACALSLLAGFSAFMFARHWEHVGWPGMWSIVMLGVTVGSAVSAGLALRRPKPGVAAADATRIYLFLHGLLAAGHFLLGLRY